MTAAALKDSDDADFLVVCLPSEDIGTDQARQAWGEFFDREFKIPVVIGFGYSDDKTWTFEGSPHLLKNLLGCNVNDLPWEIIFVRSSEPPPIPSDQ